MGSFTTYVIFLENKNIKWSKKKKKLWLLDASEPNRNTGWSLREAAWDRRPRCWAAGGNPALGSLAGPLQSCWPQCNCLWVSLSAGPLPGRCLIDVGLRVHRDPDSETFLSLPQLLTSTFELGLKFLFFLCLFLMCLLMPMCILRNAQFLCHFSCTKFHYVSET